MPTDRSSLDVLNKRGTSRYFESREAACRGSLYAAQFCPLAGGPGKLTRKSVINQLQLRYENPYSVDQRDMYLCGPAAVVFVLFLKYPARSVQICQSLFEKGEIGPPLTSSKTIRAAEALRERDLPPGMSQVDWMLIATLREAENLFFTVDPQASKLAQMAGQVTTAFAMENWAREVLFYTHVESTSCNFFGETDAMRKAEAAVAQGGCAFLNINATPLDQLIHGTPPDTPIQGFGNISTPINMADHWIAVAERIEMKDGKIRFPCFTWGKRVVIEADQTTFNRCLFYVVTAY